MRYVALLRGVNMLGSRRVEMKKLKALLESLGYANVSTYINSGNALFESDKEHGELRREIEHILKSAFGFEVPTLVKTERDMKRIAAAIPMEWQCDAVQRSDVVYLFPEVDSKALVATLPVNREYVNVRYVRGALVLNFDRGTYAKGHTNKLISHQVYQFMTMRNVNTARFLAAYRTTSTARARASAGRGRKPRTGAVRKKAARPR